MSGMNAKDRLCSKKSPLQSLLVLHPAHCTVLFLQPLRTKVRSDGVDSRTLLTAAGGSGDEIRLIRTKSLKAPESILCSFYRKERQRIEIE